MWPYRSPLRGFSVNNTGPHERPIADAREIGADIHHRWRQAKATGDAEALARVHALAKESGVRQEDLDQITGGFKAIARELVGNAGNRHRRKPFAWPRRRRLVGPGEAPEVLPPDPKELPRGRP